MAVHASKANSAATRFQLKSSDSSAHFVVLVAQSFLICFCVNFYIRSNLETSKFEKNAEFGGAVSPTDTNDHRRMKSMFSISMLLAIVMSLDTKRNKGFGESDGP